VLYPTPFKNLHIIPSTRDLAGAEIEFINEPNRETILKNRIAALKNHYEYIIIDCPPSLGLLTINALASSDKAIIPVQCEYFALEGIASLVNTLNLIKESINPSLEIAGIVLTMYDVRTTLNRQVVENTRLYFKELVFDTIIPRNVRLSEAPSHGLPIALYEPESRGAMAYYNLAEEVVKRV
jgi:chromosome partitioning protein